MKAYIAVSVHYINEDWVLVSELLSFAELPGSHSGPNMAAHLFKIIKKMSTLEKVLILHVCGLPISHFLIYKLGHITSDNATVNDTAMRALSALCKQEGIDWDADEHRVRCALRILIDLSKLLFLLYARCMAHIVNLAQADFIRGLSDAILLNFPDLSSATALATATDNEDDELEILKQIKSFDPKMPDKDPFPAGSLLFKVRAFIAKVSLSS